jgi:hypothetical protein
LEPHEPILLLAIMTGPIKSLPRDVRGWFGKTGDSRVAFNSPDEPKRRKFFQGLLDYVKKPPTQFPDAVKRRRRILEVLPVAPPLPPRELSAAEIAAQEKHDTLLFYKLKSHLSSIFAQCRKVDNKFCKATIGQTVGNVQTEDGIWWGRPRRLTPTEPAADATTNGTPVDPSTVPREVQDLDAEGNVVAPAAPTHGRNRLHDIDMVRIHDWIWEGHYHTSTDFLKAIRLVRENAEMEKNDDYPETKDMFRRADKVYGIAQEEVGRTEPMFNLETERMAQRFRDRARKAREAREKEEEEAKAKENGIAAAANGEDIAMIITSPQVDSNMEDRSALKRAREEDASNGSDDGSHHPSKRMRMSPFGSADAIGEKMVRFASDLPALPSISVNGDAIPDSDMAGGYDPPSPSPTGRPPTSKDPTTESGTAAKEVAPLGLTQHVIFTPSRTPSPGPSTPPEFIVLPNLYSKLEETLGHRTANLDVEQLEALRASCLNLVWSHRGDWDRTALMREMVDAINHYLVEIGEMSEEEG